MSVATWCSVQWRRPAVWLASFYMAILVVISLFFSISLYTISSLEIERGSQRQAHALEPYFNLLPGKPEDIFAQRVSIVAEAKERLLIRLLFTNIFIALGAGFISYLLALRTIRPIEEAHEAQSRFTADASHELRSPIAAMRLENELAASDPKLDVATARQQMNSTVEELDRMTSLLEGLLQLARGDVDSSAVSSVYVSKVVSKAATTFQAIAQQKHITIQSSVPTTLCATANKQVFVDALYVLLDNAVKYSDEHTAIAISATENADCVCVHIADQGMGIAKKDLGKIFDRFYRADSARTRQASGGYGLGLAIAKQTIELYGGSISCESTVGKGSTFTICLPKPSTT